MSYLYDSSIHGVGEYELGQVTPPNGPITVANLTNSLTNLVFWERNPSIRGKRLTQGSKEAATWSKILTDEVRPALHNSSTQWRIGQLIFFSRHPDVRGHFKDQSKDRQEKLQKEFEDIRKNLVQPWLNLQIARGRVNSRTIFVVDNDAFGNLPWESRTRAGNEIASQFAFVNGSAPMTVIFLDPGRFPEAFNFSDAVVSVTDPITPPTIHVFWALKQQVNNLNRALDALGSRQRFPAPDRTQMIPERIGFASMNKFVTSAAQGTQVAAPLMASAVNVNDLIDFLNKEHVPTEKDQIPKDRTKWTDGQKDLVGIALGRAMAHEVRHLYVSDPNHAADGLGSAGARLFRQDTTFSSADKTSIKSSITMLEGQQGTRDVAASFAAAERSLDFPF
jgi:hypothetical protein